MLMKRNHDKMCLITNYGNIHVKFCHNSEKITHMSTLTLKVDNVDKYRKFEITSIRNDQSSMGTLRSVVSDPLHLSSVNCTV